MVHLQQQLHFEHDLLEQSAVDSQWSTQLPSQPAPHQVDWAAATSKLSVSGTAGDEADLTRYPAEDDVEAGEDVDCGGCDEEDPLGMAEPNSSGDVDMPVQTDGAGNANGGTCCKRESSRSKRSLASSSRLDELAKPKVAAQPEAIEVPKPVKKEKKPKNMRPSLLLRLKPTNLMAAMESFFASGFSEPPKFTYAFPEEYVTQHFQENSNVCFELLPDAKRILQRVQNEYGGPAKFMDRLYGDGKITAERHRETVLEYVKDLGIEDKVDVRIVDDLLSAANVIKPSPDEKFVVNVCGGPIAQNMVQGICDHEVGTHLLRMMNDEHQVWHGVRHRYKLANPWTTEEGFATLNTYQSMPCKLLYPQALRYWAVCRGAQLGFVELFRELEEHVPDPKRRWQMCCRIKRGMIDTSLPGAFYMDQAYFKGAVEILRHLEEVDFGRLYGGQIALQDMDKVHFLLRKEVVRLPKFLNSADTLRIYKAYCRRLIKENQIEIASERICKQVFIRTAKDFFAAKPKAALKPTAMLCPYSSDVVTSGKAQTLDLQRLEMLARPRQPSAEPAQEGGVGGSSNSSSRNLDFARLAALAMPRRHDSAAAEEQQQQQQSSGGCGATVGILDEARLLQLARPRQAAVAAGGPALAVTSLHATGSNSSPLKHPRELNLKRLHELAQPAAPRPAPQADPPSSSRSTSAPPAATAMRSARKEQQDPAGAEALSAEQTPRLSSSNSSRAPDMTRLEKLSQPRPSSKEETCTQQGAPPPPRKRRKKKKRSKHRLLAMVQEQHEDHEEQSDEEDAVDDGEDELQQAEAEAASAGHPAGQAEASTIEAGLRASSQPLSASQAVCSDSVSACNGGGGGCSEAAPRAGATTRSAAPMTRARSHGPCGSAAPMTRARSHGPCGSAAPRSWEASNPSPESILDHLRADASWSTTRAAAQAEDRGHHPTYQGSSHSVGKRPPLIPAHGQSWAGRPARQHSRHEAGTIDAPVWKPVPIKVLQLDLN